jgi:hypothetical protein
LRLTPDATRVKEVDGNVLVLAVASDPDRAVGPRDQVAGLDFKIELPSEGAERY